MKLARINHEKATIYKLDNLTDVRLNPKEQILVYVGKNEAEQFRLNSVGDIHTEEFAGRWFNKSCLYQVLGHDDDGVLIIISDLDEVVNNVVDLKIPVIMPTVLEPKIAEQKKQGTCNETGPICSKVYHNKEDSGTAIKVVK